jgi:hypothetical protein
MIKLDFSFKIYIKNAILSDVNIGKYYSIIYPNSKYFLDDILDDIINVLKNGISWRNIRSLINWNVIYFHFKRFVKFDIFKNIYLSLQSKYLTKNNPLIQIIDSTFIMNKFGKNYIARNIFFKNKNCNKISIITGIINYQKLCSF